MAAATRRKAASAPSPVVNVGWVGDREGATVHATNPPPEGHPYQPYCGTSIKSEMTVVTETLADVNCGKCLSALTP